MWDQAKLIGYSLKNSLKITDLFIFLFILCEYIMGIILFYLYESVFFNHAIASRAIPLVLALLSGNCPLLLESLENPETFQN